MENIAAAIADTDPERTFGRRANGLKRPKPEVGLIASSLPLRFCLGSFRDWLAHRDGECRQSEEGPPDRVGRHGQAGLCQQAASRGAVRFWGAEHPYAFRGRMVAEVEIGLILHEQNRRSAVYRPSLG